MFRFNEKAFNVLDLYCQFSCLAHAWTFTCYCCYCFVEVIRKMACEIKCEINLIMCVILFIALCIFNLFKIDPLWSTWRRRTWSFHAMLATNMIVRFKPFVHWDFSFFFSVVCLLVENQGPILQKLLFQYVQFSKTNAFFIVLNFTFTRC